MATKEVKEKIKKDVINHPAGRIEITYEPGKTEMTPQDKQLVDTYIKLHDFDNEMSQDAQRLFNQFVPVNKKIDGLRIELGQVKEIFEECRKLADALSEPTYDPAETNLDKLAEAQQETSNKLLPYSDILIEVYETIKPLSEEIDAYYVRDEDDANVLYDEFFAIQMAHSKNWERNSIDIVAFDREADNFRGSRTIYKDRRETLLDHCRQTLDNYKTLNLETEVLYKMWEEFLKRCNLIRAIAALQEQATGFTPN